LHKFTRGKNLLKTLLNSLKGTDWEMLTDFVSPVFFDVVPTLGMASVFAKIAKDYANKPLFKTICDEIQSKIADPLAVKLAPGEKTANKSWIQELSNDDKKIFGEKVLQLYFAQLFSCDVNILDLRAQSFSSMSTWSPNSIYYRWNPEFKGAVSLMYKGFYLDDHEAFKTGLRQMNLEHAADIFRAHFGSGDQDAVVFKLSEFKKSFHSIFVSCKENRAKLHPDFFALGVYLVCLYDNLEALGVPLNVRRAFTAAQGLS
jgi:hypothetical protein